MHDEASEVIDFEFGWRHHNLALGWMPKMSTHWSYLKSKVDETMGLVPNHEFMRIHTKSSKFSNCLTPKSLSCILLKINLNSHFLVEIFRSKIWRCYSASNRMDIMWIIVGDMWKNTNRPCVNLWETLGYVWRGTRQGNYLKQIEPCWLEWMDDGLITILRETYCIKF